MDIDDFDTDIQSDEFEENDQWNGFDDGYGSAEYDDFLSQYDDDPSPYDGTYSEE